MNNNSLDNVHSINNILWNIETGMLYQNYKKIHFILGYEMTAGSAVYLFTQNYTQTAIACGDNK